MKAFFLTRLTREKFLVLAFLALVCAVWIGGFSKRAKAFTAGYASTGVELEEQQRWLSSKDQIEADAAKAIARLDPAQTLDSTKLLAEVNRIANEVGITSNVQADDTKDERSSLFALHSLRLTIKKADYASLVRFYVALQKRSPYIGLEQFSLQAEPNNAVQLTAMFRLTSVEVLKP